MKHYGYVSKPLLAISGKKISRILNTFLESYVLLLTIHGPWKVETNNLNWNLITRPWCHTMFFPSYFLIRDTSTTSTLSKYVLVTTNGCDLQAQRSVSKPIIQPLILKYGTNLAKVTVR